MTVTTEIDRSTTLTKILIPIGDLFSRELITEGLYFLSTFKNPKVVLFHVIEVPSRTATLETEPYSQEIQSAKQKLNELQEWLTAQGLEVQIKVAVARSSAEGIIEEIESDGYLIVFLMKKKLPRGWRRLVTHSVSERVIRSANCLVMTAPLGYPKSRPSQ